MTDPQQLRIQEQRRRARDPATHPGELLFDLVPLYPKEVAQNPVLPLLSVEQPALWQELHWKIERHRLWSRLAGRLWFAPRPQRLFFAAECAARGLGLLAPFPWLEEACRYAEVAKRAAAFGACDRATLAQREAAVSRELNRLWRIPAGTPAIWVGRGLASRGDRLAGLVAGGLARAHGGAEPTRYFPALLREMSWQEERLSAILREPPPGLAR